MKAIVNFSGGLCSFFASDRAIREFGPDNVVNLFADTLIEHPDLYDFNRRSEDLLGVPLTRVSLEINPWELFRREGLIGNTHAPICSVRLKREPLNAWMESRYNLSLDQQSLSFLPDATVVLGFDWNEPHRVSDFQAEHPSWRLRAPMTEAPIWDKCRMITEATRLGFPERTLYKLGFPHDNCGGGCVRAGISHFVHLLKVLPDRFAWWENEEQLTLAEFARRGVSNGHFTILRDRRNGQTIPLSLKRLRERVEAGEKFPEHDWGGCGCGGAVNPVIITE